VRVRRIQVAPLGQSTSEAISVRTALTVQFEFWNLVPEAHLNLTLVLNTLAGDCVFAVSGARGVFSKALHRVECLIPGDLLNDGLYSIDMYVIKDLSTAAFVLRDAATFQVNDVPREGGWMDKWPGVVRPSFKWISTRVDESKGDGHDERALVTMGGMT
jgi:lipopolysaccharide transport system ATP-binding protein